MRISDWSSDVCSSDLPLATGPRRHPGAPPARREHRHGGARHAELRPHRAAPGASARRLALGQGRGDRKSVVSGKSVAVRVDLGGRRNIKKKKRESVSETQRDSLPTKSKTQYD